MERNIELEHDIGLCFSLENILDEDELKECIQEHLDLSDEDADELLGEITNIIEDEVSFCHESLTYSIADKIQTMIKTKEICNYPEDAPGQLHLFDMEE